MGRVVGAYVARGRVMAFDLIVLFRRGISEIARLRAVLLVLYDRLVKRIILWRLRVLLRLRRAIVLLLDSFQESRYVIFVFLLRLFLFLVGDDDLLVRHRASILFLFRRNLVRIGTGVVFKGRYVCFGMDSFWVAKCDDDHYFSTDYHDLYIDLAYTL